MEINIKYPIQIYEDNQSCIQMVTNAKFSARTKHIDVRYHYIKNLYNTGIIKLVYCPTEYMIADVLTKPFLQLISNFIK